MMNLINKLKNDPRIRNSLWMLIEKGISLFGLIFIISAVAKYTGPTIYGEIALAASIFIVLKTIAQLGLDQIYFKYVSQNKPYHSLFLENSMIFVSIIYIVLSILVVMWAYFNTSFTGFFFISSTAIAYYFTSIDLANSFYEGQLLSKFNVLANIIGLFIALILRYSIVYFKLNVLYLSIPIILMSLIPFLIKFIIYKCKYHINFNKVKAKKQTKRYFSYFLGAGIPLTLAILTATINGQISNFLLAYLEGTKSVGIYSIAFVLAGAWCIVPTTLIMSYMTSIYNINIENKYEYIKLSNKVLFNIAILSLIIVILLEFSAYYIVTFLYGNEYLKSIEILRCLLIFQFFWVIGFYFSRLIIKFNGYKFLAYKSIFCCLLNLTLSYFFIKKWGVIGAAYAVLVTEVISSLVLNLFYRKANLIKVLLPIGVNRL
ncbi:oligosaccharide flippase family protein [Acinetobacter nosocomialis]|uniref:oligosaccharide flippase family protein n=1 Tax=Acinetobacter nosocomialis TaxID=106654 RepID=UPI000DE69807|nr:oligosaccharide flippase family protein [Acinetobacter nosocomialis]SSQ34335.1 Polysaccharide biosynthesis protein [Acinetobacter baumannii]MBD8352881.1 oligosaccharide flippase family protein [Acinetobacter nosocomialis]MBJ8495028.1 oligosaccharide flippase family protein [Acinetobacter nosocomialis]MBZ6530919.1 oligosaccharide flippase family protein [Acinetobacter nosocomialis]MDI9743659.1 oligosaccharide flippase family protein [Acinetobacter nosocomialis]